MDGIDKMDDMDLMDAPGVGAGGWRVKRGAGVGGRSGG